MQEVHGSTKRSPCLLLHPTDPETPAYFPAEFIHGWGGQLAGFLPPPSHLTEELGGRTISVSKRTAESERGWDTYQKLVLSKIRFYLAKKFTTIFFFFFCTRVEDRLRQGLVDSVDFSVCFEVANKQLGG